MTRRRQTSRVARRAKAFSLDEVAVCTAIVGVMLVAALDTVGDAGVGRAQISMTAHGTMLAQQLLTEIVRKDYEEPDDAPVFGRESSESGGTRSAYDDVDDYDAWSSSPPKDVFGTAIPLTSGWTRSVVVSWVKTDDFTSTAASDGGVKLIQVTVSRNGQRVRTLSAIRTSGGDVIVSDPD